MDNLDWVDRRFLWSSTGLDTTQAQAPCRWAPMRRTLSMCRLIPLTWKTPVVSSVRTETPLHRSNPAERSTSGQRKSIHPHIATLSTLQALYKTSSQNTQSMRVSGWKMLTRPIIEVPPVYAPIMRYTDVHTSPFQSNRCRVEYLATARSVFESETVLV